MNDNRGLGKVEPHILALTADNLEELDMGNSYSQPMAFLLMSMVEEGTVGLTPLQISAICTAIRTENTPLKKFVLGYSKLFSVEANLLAGALNRLEEVDLCQNFLTLQQARALFTAIRGGTKLRKRNLEGCSFSMSLDLELLATALHKLKEVKLTKLTGHQINAVMSKYSLFINTNNSKLKVLSLPDETPLASLEPSFLARVANKMESLHMSGL